MPIIDGLTGSETIKYADGLVDVYGSANGVLLTVRREPRDIYKVRSVEMTAEQAQEIANSLLAAAAEVTK